MSKRMKVIVGIIVAIAFNVLAQSVMDEKQILGCIVGLIMYFEITR